jgi:SAM-dependent methyltransferase
MRVETMAAVDWWAQPRAANAAEWISAYKNSLHARHRNVIADVVKRYDASSLLEVGCHCGPNLIRLAQDIPTLTDLFGIDASQQAIDAGSSWADEAGLSGRVQMRVGRFPEGTAAMPTGCADIVLSCYTLAYLSPADLDPALFEIGRLARRVVILAEPLATGATKALTRTAQGYQEYAHAYGSALKWIGSFRGMTLRMVDIAPPVDFLNAVLVLERTS